MGFLLVSLLLLLILVIVVTLVAVVGWSAHRRRERESFYAHQLFGRLSELDGMTPERIRELMGDERAHGWARREESLRVAGVVSLAVGALLFVAPWVLRPGILLSMPSASPEMLHWARGMDGILPSVGALGGVFGLVCLGVGAGLLVYVYALSPRTGSAIPSPRPGSEEVRRHP